MDNKRSDELREIRNILGLNVYPWENLHDDILELAFISETKYSEYFKNKYNMGNNDVMEFVGDSLLNMIVADFLVGFVTNKPIRYSHHFISNPVLICLMMKKNLCHQIVNVTGKACADRLEAIIGALWFYLTELNLFNDAYELLYKWLITTFNFQDLIDELETQGLHYCSKSVTKTELGILNLYKINHRINIILPQRLITELTKLKNSLKLLVYDESIEDPDDINTNMLRDIPLELLFLAVNNQKMGTRLENSLNEKYGFSNNNQLKFLGHRVFRVLIAFDIYHLIYLNVTENINYFAKLFDLVASKKIISSVLLQKGLPITIPDFYSILGAIYYYLHYIRHEPYAMEIIHIWFLSFWPIEFRINYMILNQFKHNLYEIYSR